MLLITHENLSVFLSTWSKYHHKVALNCHYYVLHLSWLSRLGLLSSWNSGVAGTWECHNWWSNFLSVSTQILHLLHSVHDTTMDAEHFVVWMLSFFSSCILIIVVLEVVCTIPSWATYEVVCLDWRARLLGPPPPPWKLAALAPKPIWLKHYFGYSDGCCKKVEELKKMFFAEWTGPWTSFPIVALNLPSKLVKLIWVHLMYAVGKDEYCQLPMHLRNYGVNMTIYPGANIVQGSISVISKKNYKIPVTCDYVYFMWRSVGTL